MSFSIKSALAAALCCVLMSNMTLATDIGQGVRSKHLTTNQDSAYEVYGIIAMQTAYRNYHTDDPNHDEDFSGLQLNNESRIGLRGRKQFNNFGPTFIWQIETGYVDPSFGGPGAFIGERDTFVGFESHQLGQLRFGRVLTPIYELIDWPGSNPGLADVYDWGGAIGGAKYQDRQSNTIRWDSPIYMNSLSFDLAVGAGDDAAVGQGDSYWFGGAAHYNLGLVQFDLGYEQNDNVESESTIWTNNTYLIGLQAWFDNGVSLFAQYKHMMAASKTNIEEVQGSMTSGLMYTTGDWQYKLAYAANFKLERDGEVLPDSGDKVISAQLQYNIDPSAIVYWRIRFNNFNDGVNGVDGKDRATSGSNGDFDEYSIGIEYYF